MDGDWRDVFKLPHVGEWLTLGLTAVPWLALILLYAWTGQEGIGGWFFVLLGVSTAWWLDFLKKRAGLSVVVPYIGIPVIVFTPVAVLYGLGMLVGWVEPIS